MKDRGSKRVPMSLWVVMFQYRVQEEPFDGCVWDTLSRYLSAAADTAKGSSVASMSYGVAASHVDMEGVCQAPTCR